MVQAHFRFVSEAAGGSQFTVVSFSANEAISSLYRYELEIKSSLSTAVNLDDVLDNPARFITEREGQEYPVYGVISSIEELKTVQGYVHYRTVLVPRLWWLSIYKTNEIYTTETTVDVIIQTVLENAGLYSGTDFDISGLVTGQLLKRDYRCQFGESDFDFLSRLMENEGIFYYFDHSSGLAEKIVFINDMSYQKIPQPGLIFEVTPSSLRQHDCIHAWSCRKQRLPASVTVRDYNPDHPSLDISGTMAIDQMGQGTEYLYGENIIDENEASYLSEIRAEEQQCTRTRYHGESSVTRLQPGYVFTLDQHPNELYNEVDYLVVEARHEGSHLDMTLSSHSDEDSGATPYYRNHFIAIDASEQFRPARLKPKPRFYGTMTAFVYAETGNNNAEIDEYGRYRVHLPFDRADGTKESTDPNRKASTWIRRAQDYVGEGKGSYFPLTGGTEVLLSFINGDPDQPIIVGAVPNASEPSLLTSDNEFESTTQTGSGNKIRMGDVEGQDRIVLESPMANSWMRIGTRNDPITLHGESPQYVDIGSGSYSDPMAYSTDSTDPLTPLVSVDFGYSEIKDHAGNIVTGVDTSIDGEYILKYEDSNNSHNVAFRKVIVCDIDARNDLSGTITDGIRIHSAGDLRMEAKSRYGEYYTGKPAIPASAANPPELGDLLDNFGTSCKPKNLFKRETFNPATKKYLTYCSAGKTPGGTDDDSFSNALANAHVHVSSLDTVNIQQGNVYDFGGYWAYNLGNGYTESHVYQKSELNQMHGQDIGFFKFFSKLDDKKITTLAFTAAGTGVSAIISFLSPLIAMSLAANAANQKGGGVSGAVYLGITSAVLPIVSIGSTIAGLALKVFGSVKNIGDVIEGPNSGVIKTWAEKVGSSFDVDVLDDGTVDPNAEIKQTSDSLKQKLDAQYGEYGLLVGPSREHNPNRPMHTDTTWVDKKFGDSYNFTQGNTINIVDGNTEEHIIGDVYSYKYGGAREQMSFSKGFLSKWTKAAHGATLEANWDKASGQMANFSYSYMGLISFKLTLPTTPKLNVSVSMTTLDANVSIYAGTAINLKATTAIALNVEIAGGFSTNIKSKVGGEANLNEVTGEMELKAFGFQAAKAAALKAAKRDMVLDKLVSKLSSADLKLAEEKTAIKKYAIGTMIGQFIFM